MAESNMTMRLVLSLTVRQMVDDKHGCSSLAKPSGVPTLRINDNTAIGAWSFKLFSGVAAMEVFDSTVGKIFENRNVAKFLKAIKEDGRDACIEHTHFFEKFVVLTTKNQRLLVLVGNLYLVFLEATRGFRPHAFNPNQNALNTVARRRQILK